MEVAFTPEITGPDAPVADAGASAPAQRPAGLPENFDSVEALVASYKEAQAKLTKSTQDGEQPPQDNPDTGTGEEDGEDAAPAPLPENLRPFSAEFAKDGKLGDESYTKLAELGYSKDVVDAYIRGVTAAPQAAEAITPEDAKATIAAIGGDEVFTKLQTWAGQNLSEAEIESYNAATASKATARMAVEWLKGRMEAAEGFEPAVVVAGDTVAGSAVAPFRSRQELTAAMRDPRYKSGDKAYHAEVDARLRKSSLMR